MRRGAVLLACLLAVGSSNSIPAQEECPSAERLLELERQVRVGEVETARLRRVIAELEARLDASATSTLDAPVAPPSVSPPPPPVLDLGGEIEGVDVEDIDLDLEPPPSDPSSSDPSSSDPSSSDPSSSDPPSSDPPPIAAPISDAAQSLYDHGYTLYNQGLYAEAENAFQGYVEAHPGTELADNAQFWIGECRFARQDFQGALEAFLRTVERYPEGNKIPDAMLKAGRSLEEMGAKDDALATYREIRRLHPGTAASALAKERLTILE